MYVNLKAREREYYPFVFCNTGSLRLNIILKCFLAESSTPLFWGKLLDLTWKTNNPAKRKTTLPQATKKPSNYQLLDNIHQQAWHALK